MWFLLQAVEASYFAAGPYIYRLLALALLSMEYSAYRRSSIRIVSMVKSRFHCAKHGSFVGSTYDS